MLPLVVAPAAAAVATESPPPPGDLDAPPALRSGVVLGLSLGGGPGSASGYPNNAVQIGDPNYYSASGWMAGTSETVFAMGAIADYLSFGFWFSHSIFRNGDWRSSGSAGGLRTEVFPLIHLYPRLQGLGLLAQFGIGSASLTATRPGFPEAEGTQSSVGAGVFYEWAFGRVFGGHFGAGPSLEYDAIFSQPFERHGMVASVRAAFYGGP